MQLNRTSISLIHLSILAVLASAIGCAPSRQAQRYSRAQVQESLDKLEAPGLVIGEFALAGKPIVDGDTVKVEGLDSSLRLLAIDTEETIKSKYDRVAVEGDWKTYLQNQRGDSIKPVKSGTPMGEIAKEWAIDFFRGVDRVRLERDHPKEIRGGYGRYLSYVFALKDGQWVNYNIECVRAGMSPYYTKYSYSRRFHDEFVAAEKEAREAQRGIWDPNSQSYGDYDERKAWWDARAEFIKDFERDAHGKDDHIVLSHWDSLANLEKNMGQEVTVLGAISKVIRGDRGPSRIRLARKKFNDLTVVFFDKDVFAATGVAEYSGEFVRVTGVVSEYTNKYNKKREIQLIVNLPSQVVKSDIPHLRQSVQSASTSP